MKSVPDFLECDVIEMALKRIDMSDIEFNDWFDSSLIKLGLKKRFMILQGFRCCYCQKINFTCNNRHWDLEHILSELLYPEFFADPLNLSVACSKCNTAKSHKDVLVAPHVAGSPLPRTSESYTIPHPNIDTWHDHLKHTHYLIYEALTDKGNALISMCKLLGDAAEAAGQTAEAVEEAVEVDFFELLPNPVVGIDPTTISGVVHAAMTAVEKARLQPIKQRALIEVAKIEGRRERAWMKSRSFRLPA